MTSSSTHNADLTQTDLNSGLHIIAPGICGPLAETQSLKNSETLSKWVNTLSRSQRNDSSVDVHEVIKQLFKLECTGDFPSAALTLLGEKRYDPEKFYMHADPVHLQADIDQAILTPADDLQIKGEEADVLCEVLNQHFLQDGLHFFYLDEKRWYVASKHEIHIKTTALHNAIARNVNFLLLEDTGDKPKNSMNWKQIFTESQMLLHSHEVNEKRERQGLQSINSLWFHGSGSLSDGQLEVDGKLKVNSICSDDKLFSGLSEYLNNLGAQYSCEYQSLPVNADEYIDKFLSGEPGVNILHLPQLEHLVDYDDTRIWRDGLEPLLEEWLYPLLAFCRSNNITLTLYPCAGSSYRFSKYDVLKFGLKFWRRGRIEQYVSCY